MKYIIAFLGLLEATTSGTLEKTFRLNQDLPRVAPTLNTNSTIETNNDMIIAEVRRSLKKQLRRRRLR